MPRNSSIGPELFPKVTILAKKPEKLQNRRSCSTSYSCGNQVDGLPRAANTKTIVQPARVGPRTEMPATMEKLFRRILSSSSCWWRPIIVLDYTLKPELPNDSSHKNSIEISKEMTKCSRHRFCSSGYSRGNHVDGLPRASILAARCEPSTWFPREREFVGLGGTRPTRGFRIRLLMNGLLV